MSFSGFHPLITQWFHDRVGQPTDVQLQAWPAIHSGSDALIAAPTGSGKTLAAFLSSIDNLFRQARACELEAHTQVLYVSPLKALSNDVQKNLQEPLAEISQAALQAGLLMPELRVLVRTGDTPMTERQQMLKRPPHVLVTTPESLFILLTAEKSRRMLQTIRTVIVDEIHALAPNKRGAHLALSLERLDALTRRKPQRIGLSATQRPIELVAQYLVGSRSDPSLVNGQSSNGEPSARSSQRLAPCKIIDVGHRRELDLAVEVPRDELSAVATNAVWADVYDRVTELVRHHRSTLVFVNTRRLVERVAHALEERLNDLGRDVVAAHHGSLSRQLRLQAEERLKAGRTRVVIATASLELGIDVGTVDLVCQIGSPRAISTCLQRVGRAGHWVDAIPKGRLFAMTRDELVECAALVRAIRAGLLDRLEVPIAPLDILAQQLVAAAASQVWTEEELFILCRRAFPYRDLAREKFDQIVRMLADGVASKRDRTQSHLYHDRVNHRIKGRRGARLAAITSGGAIPDTANYAVVAEPDGTVVGSVDEDFAVESLAGDIMLLGNTSWRIRGVEAGRVRVEDAQGAPPNIPFWRGEAPSRTAELSAAVSSLRQEIGDRLGVNGRQASETVTLHSDNGPWKTGPTASQQSVLQWLKKGCALDDRGAEQALAYVAAGIDVLGTVPTQSTIVAERFFDESGGMQLVIHAPFGGRINRAWGLALRKRFCVTFDFELQAAATDNGLVISLGEKHSFPLESVFGYIHSNSVQEVLTQAVLLAPMFASRWRWNASRSLALLRFSRGKRVPPHIQRMKAEDLLAAIFPDAIACQENLVGERAIRQIPDHPLVAQTLFDCLTEAMDLNGFTKLLTQIEAGSVRCLAIDTPLPSPFSHEILNANPYAFLDDAPLEERRARAVEMRRTLPAELAGQVGALNLEAIEEVQKESWPLVRNPDDLLDALSMLVWLPANQAGDWAVHVPSLVADGRAVEIATQGGTFEGKGNGREVRGLVAAENRERVERLFAGVDETVLDSIVQGWVESTGPTTTSELGERLCLPADQLDGTMVRLEASGQVLRGQFRPGSDNQGMRREVEWCHRRLLARIHRLTIGQLRREVEPVTATEFMRFLLQWQHLAPGSRRHGETGLLEVVRQLAGFEAAASAWESQLLRVRLAKYEPELLDRLCLSGLVSWGRLSLHPGLLQSDEHDRRRIVPTSAAPISLFVREEQSWLLEMHHDSTDSAGTSQIHLSQVAKDLSRILQDAGASFFADLVRMTNHLPSEVEGALWELVTAGLVTADGFDNLRALMDPHRRRAVGRERSRRPRHSAGRWTVFRSSNRSPVDNSSGVESSSSSKSSNSSRHGLQSRSVEPVARQLLRRYGVVFRDLLARESLVHSWRDLLIVFRRLEMTGEIRGGRFVTGFTGEQFAFPEAVESLRSMRRVPVGSASSQEVRISASDPLNLVGIILPGARVPSVPSNYVVFRDGAPVRTGTMSGDSFRDRHAIDLPHRRSVSQRVGMGSASGEEGSF